MTEKVQLVRQKEKDAQNKPSASLKQNAKFKFQVKETTPEAHNDLKSALAALKPKVAPSKTVESKPKNPQERKQGSHQDNDKDPVVVKNNPNKKEPLEKSDSNQQKNGRSKEKEFSHKTRQVKIPAHISDEQLKKILEITNKDLEL